MSVPSFLAMTSVTYKFIFYFELNFCKWPHFERKWQMKITNELSRYLGMSCIHAQSHGNWIINTRVSGCQKSYVHKSIYICVYI